MVLGSLDKSITYPRSLYESASAYGIGYLPNSLALMPLTPAWPDEENTWLASLYGLSYERIVPEKAENENEAWNEYIDRIRKLLRAGSPVQITRGWMKQRGYKEEDGKIIQEQMGRLFWWEGMTSRARPDMHYFTAVGLNEARNVLVVNDGIFGWVGKAAYEEIGLDIVRKLVSLVMDQHKYITITFKRSHALRKDDREIDELVKERIMKKLRGDPSVYDRLETWRSFYGTERFPGFLYSRKALKAFKEDIQPHNFARILKFRQQKKKIEPADILSWLDLMVYHQANIALVSAEYLEEKGRLREREWLMNQHILFEKLWGSTTMLRSVFKSDRDIDRAMEKCRSTLEKMRLTIDELITQIDLYLEPSQAASAL